MKENIIVKDESNNLYGTYKDRRSKYIVEKALKMGVQKLCLITSGNAGFSLARFAIPKGIKVVCVVYKNTKKSIKDAMYKECSKVVEIDLSERILLPKDVIALARESDLEKIWEVTNGYSESYESIIDELKDVEFDYLICPLGSGEAFVGLYDGMRKNNVHAKLVGVGVLSNPSLADKLATPWTPYKSKIKDIVSEGNIVLRLNEDEVKDSYKKYKNKFKSEPSSTVVWAGLEKLKLKPTDKVVVINSGRGLY